MEEQRKGKVVQKLEVTKGPILPQLENSHSDFATRNSSEARVIAMLEEKRVEQAALIKEFEERENFLQGLEAQNRRLKEAIEEKRSRIVVRERAIDDWKLYSKF